jgi:hypothetical protein
VDSISFVTEEDTGAVIVCASHGGASSGEYASKFRLSLLVFNDAGVGKDKAGIQALTVLAQHGIASCTVSHNSSRIGDVLDQWENGVVSHSNRLAEGTIRPGMTVQAAVDAWLIKNVASEAEPSISSPD